MSLHVIQPGLLTSVQDQGRPGHRRYGIGTAGAVDAYSFAIANLLVGNPPGTAVLEITLIGPRLRFDRAARIALCGAEIDARLDGLPLPGWRPIDLPAAAELALGACRRGARAYLAIAGGLVVPKLMGSASTDLRGGFGGMRGRALARGDVLPLGRSPLSPPDTLRIASWWIDPTPDLDFAQPAFVHVLPGHDAVVPADALFSREWRVAAASNRQGLRLQGDALSLADPRERISEPVVAGTVQLPPDGRPILLLADAQTHGGYARVGHVIAADLPRLAQLRPGDPLHFVPTARDQARRLACAQRQRLARITLAIEQRLRPA